MTEAVDITIGERCEAITIYSKCLGMFEEDIEAENLLSSRVLALFEVSQNAIV